MEKGTTHPIGRALVDHSVGKDFPSVSIESFESIPGRGLFATLSGIKSGSGLDEPLKVKAVLGSVDYITSLCRTEESSKIKQAVKTSIYGDDFVHAALSVNAKGQGKFRVMMLTGDHKSSAHRIADIVGISEVCSDLKPEDKLNHVVQISREAGGGLIMVGDGINDAPALAAATVGVVMAQRASAIAIAVADVLLLQDYLSIPFCIAKACQTTSLVKQNVALALSCIIMATLASVLGFLPHWLMVLLHEGGTLIVCLYSVRALNEPNWSLKQDLKYFTDKYEAAIARLRGHIDPSGAMQADQL